MSSLAVNGGIAAAVALLLTFPSQLFDRTLQENYADLAEWWRRRLRWLRDATIGENEGLHLGRRPHDDRSGREGPLVLEKRVFVLVSWWRLATPATDAGIPVADERFITVTSSPAVLALAVGVAVPAAIGVAYHQVRHGSSPRS